LPDDTPRTPVR